VCSRNFRISAGKRIFWLICALRFEIDTYEARVVRDAVGVAVAVVVVAVPETARGTEEEVPDEADFVAIG
ncbi:MAG: hypothetical protein WCJ25_02840, partial [Candidatus Moraniibacteriota bacterium]